VVGRGRIRWLWSCNTSGNFSLVTSGGKDAAGSGIDVLLEKPGYPASGDCAGQASSIDEVECAKGSELSEELTFEREEVEDFEYESDACKGIPMGVRTRTGRRVAPDIRLTSIDGGLRLGFSTILTGPCCNVSWAVVGSGSGYSINAADSSETELWDERAIYCLFS